MIRAYIVHDGRLKPADPSGDAVWWDLCDPTLEEEQDLERRLGVALPTKDEMQEIELSSRLYAEDGAAFMTALVPFNTEGEDARNAPITFILTDQRLVTIRYADPRVFTLFPQRAERTALGLGDGTSILLGLLEAVVDRLADVLEQVGREVDAISRSVFGQTGAGMRTGAGFKPVLERIGRNGDLTSTLRDSLTTIERLLVFLGVRLSGGEGTREQFSALVADVRSLIDHAGFMAQKITFLLDATLGLINIEQNGIIKIFSVAAVVFLPPTLVASIYGMNFEFMPELGWTLGYPFALGLMVVSAVLPYLYFKRRGWL